MKKAKSEKKPRRSQVKNPALQKKYNSRILQEYIDYDYLDQLSDGELEWLNKFTEEFHKASYKHDGTDIQDYNKVIGQDEEGKDITYGKNSNDRNNAQNRCLYGHLKNKADRNNNKKLLSYESLANSTDPTKSLENELSKDINPASMEEAYIDFLDSKEVDAMIEEYDQAMFEFRGDEGLLESQLSHLSDSPTISISSETH